MDLIKRENRFLSRYFWKIVGFLAIAVILSPIIFLSIRDGIGNAVFPFHDQLDETIFNYVFPARYSGSKIYEQMMCGIPKEGLKPFCPIFVPLYRIFDVYTAFLLQHCIVVVTSYIGTYLCVKELTHNSVAAASAAFLFALLPVHSIYGNVVAGTPLLVYAILKIRAKSCLNTIISCLMIIYYALSTSFVLSGWAAIALLFATFVIISVKEKRSDWLILLALGVLTATYVACNIDLFIEVFSADSWVSHRVESGLGAKDSSVLQLFLQRLRVGNYSYEAESKHEYIIIPVGIAILLLAAKKEIRNYCKVFIIAIGTIIVLCFLSAFFESGFVYRIQHQLTGILKSFQLARFHYFLPGAWYILLGISVAIIIEAFPQKKLYLWVSYCLIAIILFPTLNMIARDKSGIFYQNVNQINNGEHVTGYITMRNLYSEDLMETISERIGKDMSTYRVVHIGISPVAALMHGFYTIDGYSNNYPLEYKKAFREIIADELEMNDYNKAYFDNWGSRCYAFYHEWGNAYMLGKSFNGKINDLRLNFDKLKELNCRYIFSAGEILNCDRYGLNYIGCFTNDSSYWNIWVYEVPNYEENSY